MGTVKMNLIIEGQSAAKHPYGMKVQRLNGYWVLHINALPQDIV